MAGDGSLQRLPSRGLLAFGALPSRLGHVLKDARSVCHHLSLTSEIKVDWITSVHHSPFLLLGTAASWSLLLHHPLPPYQPLEFRKEDCR